jgi:hypothetical protein
VNVRVVQHFREVIHFPRGPVDAGLLPKFVAALNLNAVKREVCFRGIDSQRLIAVFSQNTNPFLEALCFEALSR